MEGRERDRREKPRKGGKEERCEGKGKHYQASHRKSQDVQGIARYHCTKQQLSFIA